MHFHDTGMPDAHVRDYIGHEMCKMLQAEKAAITTRPAPWQSDLASPLLRKQQASEKAQARFVFDADNLPLFAAGN